MPCCRSWASTTSTLAEDARNGSRDIARATVLVCFICGGLFIGQTYLAQLVWPDYKTFPQIETAFMDVSRRVGGEFSRADSEETWAS